MGLFRRSAGKTRPAKQTRADKKEAKAGQKSAAAEAKAVASQEKTQAKADRKAEKSAAKAALKTSKAAAQLVETSEKVERGTREPLTAKRVKRLIGVGKVVAPVVVPYALAAASTVRAGLDNRKAAKLGVGLDQLSAFAGPGGALHARLSHVADALAKLESGTESSTAKAFVEQTRPRITDLSVAVRAAEQMPTSRRRAAYRAISHELDTIESALLNHLGVST